jgi:predicted nucleotidyltransferase
MKSQREHLLRGVRRFVREVIRLPGVQRIALVGSLTTDKSNPKDADVLVSVSADADLQVVNLDPSLVNNPPIVIWPSIIRSGRVPKDVETLVLAPLDNS